MSCCGCEGCGGCQEGQARSEELYFISATVACGQLQQSGAYPTNEVSMKFTWWPFRRGGPPEDAEQRKWLLAPHQRKWPLVQVKKHHQQKWLLAAPSVEVAADAYPAEKSRPRDRWRA